MADMTASRREIETRARKAVSRAAPILERNLKTAAPRGETLDLSESISVDPQGLSAEAVVAVPYASFTSEGTRPHLILPRQARVLAFEWPAAGPGVFFFPRVNHPGTKANDWYKNAIAEWPKLLERELR